MVIRSVVVVLLLLVGAAAGLAATLIHARWWGLLLGLATVMCMARALPAGTLRFIFILGWMAAIGYAVTPRTEGDFLIAASLPGYGLLGGSFVVFLAVLATLPRSAARGRGRGRSDDRTILEDGT